MAVDLPKSPWPGDLEVPASELNPESRPVGLKHAIRQWGRCQQSSERRYSKPGLDDKTVPKFIACVPNSLSVLM